MFCFLNTGHVIVLFRTVSFKFCLVHVHMYARNDKKTKCQVPLGPLLRKQNIQAKEIYTSQSSARRKTGGGGVTQEMFIRGGSALRSNPLSFYIPFFTKKVPLSYIFY